MIRKRKPWQVSLEDSYQQQDEDEGEDDFSLEHLPDADAENPFRHVEMQFDRMYYRNLIDRKSTRLNSSHIQKSRMPSSA